MRTLAKQVWYWRVAVLRCLVYMGITSGTAFLTLTESYGTEQWNELGYFLRWRIYVSCAAAAGTVFVAFMDSTMGELRKVADDAGKEITTVTREVKPAESVVVETPPLKPD